MNSYPLLIFCDFDGTAANKDVGYHLFHHFSGGKNDALIPDWKAGLISSREILEREAAMVSAEPDDIFRFLDRFELSPGFPEFAAICHQQEIPLTIISEGMDFYIEHLLRKRGLADLKVLSNVGHLENGGIRIEFPYANRSCKRCGSCKGERMAEYRAKAQPGARLLFVGDGLSDICAAREADYLFAKKDLEQYCLNEDISYNKYSDFFEVADRLIELGLMEP